jgi:hypothetical protein
MIGEEPLWVISCPLCEIFKNKNITTKLYWPESIDLIQKSAFIIIDSPLGKNPIIILNDHIGEVLGETWGMMLYRCRKIFGESVRLNWNNKICKDHFYCDIKI